MLFHKAELRFRKWVDLETKKAKFIEATETEDFPERVLAYLSVALDVPVKRLEKKDWEYTVLTLMKEVSRFSPNRELPLLRDAPKESKPVDWDYDGRTWAYYSHLLAKAYGWTLEYVAEMDVNEALAHLQEIMTDDHLEKEFVYGLSEIAYPYNKSTKTSNFKPMTKPYWMRPPMKQIPTYRIRRDMLPQGRIVDLAGNPSQFSTREEST